MIDIAFGLSERFGAFRRGQIETLTAQPRDADPGPT
jgi:hypothetical protein